VGFRFMSEAGVVASVAIFMFLSSFSPITFSAQAETTRYPFKLTVAMEKTAFTVGEPINVSWTLTNIGDKNVTLYSSEDILLDFMVRDENLDPVFDYRSFFDYRSYNLWAFVIFPYPPIAPGNNVTITGTWRQIYDGSSLIRKQLWLTQVVPGTYYVSGIFSSYTYSMELETPAIRITIS
jgi:hypothetical protein